MSPSISTTIGLSSRSHSAQSAGAGAQGGLLVVAQGDGGHGTGWLSARVVIHALCACFATCTAPAHFIGAAGESYDRKSCLGQSFPDALRVAQAACKQTLGGHAATSSDLPDLFMALDRILQTLLREQAGIPASLGASSLAAVIEGSRIRGAHAGAGLALLLRAGAREPEVLAKPHFLEEVLRRTGNSQGIDLTLIPPDITASALGLLSHSTIGVDGFDVDLSPGDLLLLCSSPLAVHHTDLTTLLRNALDQGASIEPIAREIERADLCASENDGYFGRTVAFALAFLNPNPTQ